MKELVFCKLGGSVITDKARAETARPDVIARLASEIARSLAARSNLRLVLGHGSGSFGHVAALRYGTRQGVRSAADWHGFCQVAAAAARLNRLVTDRLLEAGVPVWSLPPSASAWCSAGELVSLASQPVQIALDHGLVPLVHGDVALDDVWGGTIVSTEQVLSYLARRMPPARIILVSAVDGVYTADPSREPSAQLFPEITPETWASVRAALAGSHGTDVTGGMLSKVETMVHLVQDMPDLTAHVLSGLRPGALETLLRTPSAAAGGTVIRAAADVGT